MNQLGFVIAIICVLACQVVCITLFEEKFDSTWDPSVTTSQWMWVLPTKVNQRGSQVTITVDPVSRKFDLPYPYGIDTVSQAAWLPRNIRSFSVGKTQTLRVTVDSSFTRLGSNKHPFGNLVTNPTDDPRLGSCGFLIQEPVSQTTACSFHSNNYIWNWHDRFAFPKTTGYDASNDQVLKPSYKGFVSWKNGGRTLPQNNKVSIEYDRKNQEFRWYLNGKLTRRSQNPGGYPQSDSRDVSLFSSHPNATSSTVDIEALTLTFACVVEPDKVDPFNSKSVTGLVNHNQPDSLYELPQQWFSNNTNSANDFEYLAFGQTLTYKMKSVKVELLESIKNS